MKQFVPLEDIESVLPILSEIAIWGGVSDEQREKIFKRLETGIFKKGDYIFQKGDEPSYIYIVRKGKIGLLIGERGSILKRQCWPPVSVSALPL